MALNCLSVAFPLTPSDKCFKIYLVCLLNWSGQNTSHSSKSGNLDGGYEPSTFGFWLAPSALYSLLYSLGSADHFFNKLGIGGLRFFPITGSGTFDDKPTLVTDFLQRDADLGKVNVSVA